MTRLFKAKPFESESLDQVAEAMKVTKILKKSNLDRYYNAHFSLPGVLAFSGRVFFDSKYLGSLLPDEMLALGAHEFTI